MDQSNPNLLQEFESTVDLVPVSPGIRFVNYLIDVVAFYALSFLAGILFAIGAAGAGAYDNIESSDGPGIQLGLLLFELLIIFAYYTLFEYFAKGRTLGKMATGTVVVREDGSAPTFKDAFMRTLCRFIPFEPFSALGTRPWHDSLTHTMVIKKPRKF
ncbi:MAG: RDD family protein [Flavisolibacter sp.]|nr:RDD family protein [Flavisolibacter sp.]